VILPKVLGQGSTESEAIDIWILEFVQLSKTEADFVQPSAFLTVMVKEPEANPVKTESA